LPVLAVDALQVAVGEEDVDDGIQWGLFAAVEHYGSHLKVGRSPAEAAADSAVNTAFPWTKLTFHNPFYSHSQME
jgi:hypothetical protein